MRRSLQLLALAAATCMAGSACAAVQKAVFVTPFVTRAETAMLLLQTRIPHIPALRSDGKYPDVPVNSWYERYMVLGDKLGIIQPNPVTKAMRPDAPVTRSEFLLMAVRTFGINTDLYPSSYKDVPREAWYFPIAGVAQKLHLFPDDADQSSFKPDQQMLHAEMAKAVQTLTSLSSRNDAQSTVNGDGTISTTVQRTPMVNVPSMPHLAPGAKPIVTITSMPGDDPLQLPLLREALLRLVNDARAEAKLKPLAFNSLLQNSAQKYARELAEQNFFGHVSPAGETLRDRMEASGYYKPSFQADCLCVREYLVGENLARGQRTASQVVREWLASPAHRETMLNGTFTEAGIGITSGIWVMHFGGEQK